MRTFSPTFEGPLGRSLKVRMRRIQVLHYLPRGPEDCSGIVLEWGDSAGAPFVISGQVWGEENLLRRPAIRDMSVGRGHVVSFNFNPFHRDMNLGDHRLVWNAILNWQAILSASAPSPISTSSEQDQSDP